MSFQAYLDNIEAKTGITPSKFIELAKTKGFTKDTKAGEILTWLKKDYELARGHGMALVSIIKNGNKISKNHVNSGGTHSDRSDTLILTGINNDLPQKLSAPAYRALNNANIKNLNDLTKYTFKEISDLHGIGPNALKKLGHSLKSRGLAFK